MRGAGPMVNSAGYGHSARVLKMVQVEKVWLNLWMGIIIILELDGK